jgi:hypothetical protein
MPLPNRAHSRLACQCEAFAHEFGHKPISPQSGPHAARLRRQVGIRGHPQGPFVPLSATDDTFQPPRWVAQPVARRFERSPQYKFGDSVMQSGLALRTLGVRTASRELVSIK